MLTAVLTVVLFCVMIIPHEFGHFAAAKLLGVQVNEFAIGMGPKLLQKEKGETMYSVRIFPIGGYCSMEGENEESDNPRAFNNKPAWRKLVILFAGAFMNILTAMLIMSLTVGIIGIPTNVVGNVDEGSPADIAGIQSGDRIIAVDGDGVDSWKGVVDGIANSKDDIIRLQIDRAGNKSDIEVKPELNHGSAKLGIASKPGHNPISAVKYGTIATWDINRSMYRGLYMMVTGKVNLKESVAGPVGMVSLVGRSSRQGVLPFMYLVAIICVNLAIINLLPLPALDGGRILFVLIRKVTGDVISDRTEGMVHMIGMLLLISLALLVTWNDIVKLLN